MEKRGLFLLINAAAGLTIFSASHQFVEYTSQI